MSTPESRILHLHIEKCGGTATRVAIGSALGAGARLCPKRAELDIAAVNPAAWDLISGHVGWDVLHPIGGRIVTILRDPVERFISSYYYWGDMHRSGKANTHRTALATLYSLDDFATIKDEQSLIQGLFNSMTWQLAHSTLLRNRVPERAKGITDATLLARAIANLHSCAVVGLQERMDDFAAAFQSGLGYPLAIKRDNVTAGRPPRLEISAATRRRILEWVYLDMELYQAACALVAARAHARTQAVT